MVVCIPGSHKIHTRSECFAETVSGAAADRQPCFTATAQAGEPAAAASPRPPRSPLLEAAPTASPRGSAAAGSAVREGRARRRRRLSGDERDPELGRGSFSNCFTFLESLFPCCASTNLNLLWQIQFAIEKSAFCTWKVVLISPSAFQSRAFRSLGLSIWLGRLGPVLPQARPAGGPPAAGGGAGWLSQTLFGFSFPH